MYEIVGEYRGEQEVIDQCESWLIAEFLVAEYQMAFGNEWAIWMNTRSIS